MGFNVRQADREACRETVNFSDEERAPWIEEEMPRRRACVIVRRLAGGAAEPREGGGSISRVAGPNIEALSSSLGIRAGDRDQIAISRIEREVRKMGMID
jgi:hypothetical protein